MNVYVLKKREMILLHLSLECSLLPNHIEVWQLYENCYCTSLDPNVLRFQKFGKCTAILDKFGIALSTDCFTDYSQLPFLEPIKSIKEPFDGGLGKLDRFYFH